ncbi:hypothetical protein B5807_08597 [Epicoccum nigrum]|uniref:Uncharacterized protein n=1 Tax=Epicoccum nigrum TaxID=105696 RepID=A0A1Y2LR90_EPING|nr:hypothetical protein B5807_08597 [Epicoccum nigrum]
MWASTVEHQPRVQERAGLHRRYIISSRMQCCTTAAAPYAQNRVLEAALSGETGVSLLEAFPFSNSVPSKRPQRCLLGNSFRGVAAGSEQLVVSRTGTLANSPPSLAATNHNS